MVASRGGCPDIARRNTMCGVCGVPLIAMADRQNSEKGHEKGSG